MNLVLTLSPLICKISKKMKLGPNFFLKAIVYNNNVSKIKIVVIWEGSFLENK